MLILTTALSLVSTVFTKTVGSLRAHEFAEEEGPALPPGLLVRVEHEVWSLVGVTFIYEYTATKHGVLISLDAEKQRRPMPTSGWKSVAVLGTPTEYMEKREEGIRALSSECKSRNLLLLATLYEAGVPPAYSRYAARLYKERVAQLVTQQAPPSRGASGSSRG